MEPSSQLNPFSKLGNEIATKSQQSCPCTPFDKLLSSHSQELMWRESLIASGTCGAPGEDACWQIHDMAEYNRDKIIELSKSRNNFLERMGNVSRACFIPEVQISNRYNIAAYEIYQRVHSKAD